MTHRIACPRNRGVCVSMWFVFVFAFGKCKTQTQKFAFFSSLCFFTNFVFCVLRLCFQSTLYSYTLKSQTQTTLFVFWGQHRNAKFVFVFCVCIFKKANTNTKRKTQTTNFANWGHCNFSFFFKIPFTLAHNNSMPRTRMNMLLIVAFKRLLVSKYDQLWSYLLLSKAILSSEINLAIHPSRVQ